MKQWKDEMLNRENAWKEIEDFLSRDFLILFLKLRYIQIFAKSGEITKKLRYFDL